THTGPAWDLLVSALLRLGGVLALGLVGILLADRGKDRPLSESVLFVRWRTWVAILPVWLVVVVHPLAAVVVIVALSLQAVREFAALTRLHRASRALLYAVALVSTPMAAVDFTSWRALPPLLLLVATIVPLLRQDTEDGVRDLSLTTVGMVYLPYLLTFVWLLRAHGRAGPGVVLALGLAVALSDVGAFVAGRALGRTPLAGRLSPNKTREGLLGNLIGAALGVWWTSFATGDVPVGLLVCIPFVVALGAVWGDLLESLLKRQHGAKDAGGWLPGFGGLLDRIDSLLVVAPLTYTLVVVSGSVLP
ncbi:MAG TPA: phosphatidate cytidylyltransferase, partial [Nitriliruptorales bacterium]